MPSLFAIRVLAALVGVAVLVGLGYRVGSGLERAKWLDLERQREAIAQEHQRQRGAAALAVSLKHADTTARAVAKVREVIRYVEVPIRTECDWTVAERVQLDAIYSAYFPDAATGVPDPVPGATTPAPAPADRLPRGPASRDGLP